MRTLVRVILTCAVGALATPAHSAVTLTCGDLLWGQGLGVQSQPLNNPDAGEPSDTDSKALYAEAHTKKALMSCTPSLLNQITEGPAASQLSVSDKAYLDALRAKAISGAELAKGIFLRSLGQSPNGWSTYSASAAEWRVEQARNWCDANDPGGTADAKVPGRLPTLVDGIEQLDTHAIYLGWKAIQRLKFNQLGAGCDAALKAYVQRVRQ